MSHLMTKKNRSISLLICLFALLSFCVSAQESPSKLKKQALLFERYGDIYAAINTYEKYLEKSPNRPYTTFHLAQLYESIRDYENARKYYKTAFELKPKKYAKALYHEGLMLKMTGDYEGANLLLNQVRKKLKGKGENARYRKLARSQIKGCELAIIQLEKPVNVLIRQLNETVNFDHIELSPFPLNDSLMIYASVRVNEVVRYLEKGNQSIANSSFYYAKKTDGNWKGGYEIKDSFNMPGLNVGNGVLCPHGNRFYFTVCKKNEENKNICAIYYSEKKKGNWQSPEKIDKPINLTHFTSTQPAVGLESKRWKEVIYFSSDRPGGKGGMDLWYTVYNSESNTFSDPKNMGGRINSMGDESTPFYDQENRRLYFSSNGNINIGGMDIFKTTGEMKRWEEPINLGYPVNSCADDLYYVLNPDNKSEGFFVSNRSGGNILENISCCDDIYGFSYPDYINILLKGNVVAIQDTAKVQYIENLISESPDADIRTGNPVENAIVSLYLISKEEEKEEYLINTDTTDFNGGY
ncbi:MAG: tetratricopeptide repeat protein, partial [Bacteroidetes bacterium]|nr:tetratricopeptide repeat protein [Bacteroidota bacterium]